MKINLAISMTLVTASMLMGVDKGKEVYYKKCISCHGQTGQKEALGVSKPIKTLSSEEIENALNGYKDGIYGGKYKKLKSGMARTLSEDDIHALSVYIQTFKK